MCVCVAAYHELSHAECPSPGGPGPPSTPRPPLYSASIAHADKLIYLSPCVGVTNYSTDPQAKVYHLNNVLDHVDLPNPNNDYLTLQTRPISVDIVRGYYI